MPTTALASPPIAPPAAPLALPTAETMPLIQRPPRGVQDLAQQLDHPSGYLALSSGNQHFVLPAVPGFIAYRKQGRHLFLFGGVHGGPATWQPLLDAFLAYAAGQRRAVVAVQLRAPQIALFAERGFTVNPLGSSFGLHLPDFRLAGTRRMKLRNKIVRARRLGLQVREVGPEIPRSPATWAALSAISDSWLRRKGKKELDFMIGELGAPDDAQRRVFVVEYTDSEAGNEYPHSGRIKLGHNWVGFITYVPVYGQHPGYLHDLTRRLPTAPPGAMELCNAEAMTRLQAEGVRYLHFGFTPFITGETLGEGDTGIPDLPAGISSRWLDRAIRLLHRYGRAIYPAQSQADYKRKWGPDLIEPEYVAARPLSLRAIWDLLRLTRSL
ncbi:MAG TPA: DUF2156 domain-containing protein [Pseudomonadota bacterium]|nr:DUF2156 domain-containing protein [Pseudomonadota bacterium]